MKTSRLRWLVAEYDLSLSGFASALNEIQYGNKRPIGFELIDVKKNMFLARFIQRENKVEEIINPLGKIEKYESTRYIVFDFKVTRLTKGKALIRVIDPPASLKSFIMLISDICDKKLSIEKVELDLVLFYRKIKTIDSVIRYDFIGLQASGIQFGKTSIAKMELASSSNVFDDFLAKYKNKKYKLEKIKFKARVNSSDELVELSSSGLAKCTKGIESVLENYVLSCYEL